MDYCSNGLIFHKKNYLNQFLSIFTQNMWRNLNIWGLCLDNFWAEHCAKGPSAADRTCNILMFNCNKNQIFEQLALVQLNVIVQSVISPIDIASKRRKWNIKFNRRILFSCNKINRTREIICYFFIYLKCSPYENCKAFHLWRAASKTTPPCSAA